MFQLINCILNNVVFGREGSNHLPNVGVIYRIAICILYVYCMYIVFILYALTQYGISDFFRDTVGLMELEQYILFIY
jgi:hypothetical protein